MKNHGVKIVGMVGNDVLCDNYQERSRVTIEFSGTRSGKAQPLDSKVLTPSGFRRMGDLKEGDFVLSPEGQSVSIAGIFPQGKKQVFEVSFQDGRTTRCCEDHLWKVWSKKVVNGKSGVGWKVVPLYEIIERLNRGKWKRTAVPLVEPFSIELPERQLPIPPYTLGCLLGDGDIGSSIRITTADPEHILTRILDENPGYEANRDRLTYTYRLRAADASIKTPVVSCQVVGSETSAPYARGGRNRSSIIVEHHGETAPLSQLARRSGVGVRNAYARVFRMGWTICEALGCVARKQRRRTPYTPISSGLDALGLRSLKSHEKFVPELYKIGSVEQRLALLQGLLDTDGSVGAIGTGAEFSSTSERLARDVQEIAWSLGAIATIRQRQTYCTYKGEKRAGLRSWRVSIIHQDIARMFSLPRKVRQCQRKNMRHRLRMLSVRSAGTEAVQCISLSGGEGLYITDDYVVTHNTASLISTVAYWAKSDLPQVILDPSCEIGPMTWRLLTKLKRDVRLLNPDPNPVDSKGNPVPWRHLIASYDALGWIDIHKPGASGHVRTFGRYFIDDDGVKEDGNSAFFRKNARNLLSCILAHILWDEGPCPAPKTLATMREIISLDSEEITDYLTAVRYDSRSPMARQLAGRLAKTGAMAPKTFENILSEADQATAWLTDPELARLVSGDDFHANDITERKPVTVIVQIPMDTLITDPCIARVIFGSFFSAKVASKSISDTLFIPDEAWLLGKMQALKIALFAGGKHGIVMHMPWQSMGQIEDIWGQSGRKFWLDNAAYILVGKIRDPNVAKEISEIIGTMPVIAYSEGDNRGVQGGTGFWGRVSRGRNLSKHEIKRPVRMVSEVISDLKRDELFLIGLERPAQIKRALWFRIPWLADEIEPSPFQQDEMEDAA